MGVMFWAKLYILSVFLLLWLMFLVLERKLLWATLFLLVAWLLSLSFFPLFSYYLLRILVLELWLVLLVYQKDVERFFRQGPILSPEYGTIAEEVRMFLEFALKNKLSGILVFKRKDSLRAFKETGEPIRARLDATVLSQFFAPDSLFKEGAVIIEGPEITAVNCVLPKKGPKYLSVLERSALALSQITDALVVVFSRGKVKIFLEGSRAEVKPERVEAILRTLRSGRKIKVV